MINSDWNEGESLVFAVSWKLEDHLPTLIGLVTLDRWGNCGFKNIIHDQTTRFTDACSSDVTHHSFHCMRQTECWMMDGILTRPIGRITKNCVGGTAGFSVVNLSFIFAGFNYPIATGVRSSTRYKTMLILANLEEPKPA